ncbi:hypothetical protein QAD02_005457 [Eretmocerus hayati]|uniref:Uncharacterized protein n=1 Tax=Eretmocerus hayati TaxID=131215 RepID=A0ACC2NSL4_9HYME|nr:hypothetical protein QAD02_005457 [Eretmocerus hayati]
MKVIVEKLKEASSAGLQSILWRILKPLRSSRISGSLESARVNQGRRGCRGGHFSAGSGSGAANRAAAAASYCGLAVCAAVGHCSTRARHQIDDSVTSATSEFLSEIDNDDAEEFNNHHCVVIPTEAGCNNPIVMEIEVVTASGKSVASITAHPTTSIGEIKQQLHTIRKAPYPQRQCIRVEPKGRALKDSDTIKSLQLKYGSKLYYKDLGPQIGWKTVFLAEYAGPLVVYLWLYQRPWIFYGDAASAPMDAVVHWAAVCWSIHYVKRLLETMFVHRFSHATMPLRNLFKNCSYYWLFAMYVSYYVNHPLYTPPHPTRFIAGLGMFLVCELGNLCIHLALRNLRPPGTTVRKIPRATSNPFTVLFNFVSCPNYTYEIGSWIGFTIMTQCIPAGLFALAGAYQMTVWALGKHKLYKKEFTDYPKSRKAIIPFVL